MWFILSISLLTQPEEVWVAHSSPDTNPGPPQTQAERERATTASLKGGKTHVSWSPRLGFTEPLLSFLATCCLPHHLDFWLDWVILLQKRLESFGYGDHKHLFGLMVPGYKTASWKLWKSSWFWETRLLPSWSHSFLMLNWTCPWT